MRVHNTIPFNIQSYAAAKPTTDTSQTAPLYSTTAVTMAYGYSSDTARNQHNSQSTSPSDASVPTDISEDNEQSSEPSQAIAPQYNSNASLARTTVTLGKSFDAFA